VKGEGKRKVKKDAMAHFGVNTGIFSNSGKKGMPE